MDVYDTSPYWEVLTQYSDKEYTVEDAVKLWRKIISTSETTVDICTTGYYVTAFKLTSSAKCEFTANLNAQASSTSEPKSISNISGLPQETVDDRRN